MLLNGWLDLWVGGGEGGGEGRDHWVLMEESVGRIRRKNHLAWSILKWIQDCGESRTILKNPGESWRIWCNCKFDWKNPPTNPDQTIESCIWIWSCRIAGNSESCKKLEEEGVVEGVEEEEEVADSSLEDFWFKSHRFKLSEGKFWLEEWRRIVMEEPTIKFSWISGLKLTQSWRKLETWKTSTYQLHFAPRRRYETKVKWNEIIIIKRKKKKMGKETRIKWQSSPECGNLPPNLNQFPLQLIGFHLASSAGNCNRLPPPESVSIPNQLS